MSPLMTEGPVRRARPAEIVAGLLLLALIAFGLHTGRLSAQNPGSSASNGNGAPSNPCVGGSTYIDYSATGGAYLCSGTTWVGPNRGALTATTGSIGGSLLAAGGCSTGTVSVPALAVPGDVVMVTPSDGTEPGSGLGAYIQGAVTSSGTVTVSVCSPVVGTPAAKTYVVRVFI